MGVSLATPLDLDLSLDAGTTYGFHFHRTNSCGIHFHTSSVYSTPLSNPTNPERFLQNDDVIMTVGAYSSNSSLFSSVTPFIMPVIQLFYEVASDTPLHNVLSSLGGPFEGIDSLVTDNVLTQVTTATALPNKSTTGILAMGATVTSTLDSWTLTSKQWAASLSKWTDDQRKKSGSAFNFAKTRQAGGGLSAFARAGIDLLVSTNLIMISTLTVQNPALLAQFLNNGRMILERYFTMLIPGAESIAQDISGSLTAASSFLLELGHNTDRKSVV